MIKLLPSAERVQPGTRIARKLAREVALAMEIRNRKARYKHCIRRNKPNGEQR